MSLVDAQLITIVTERLLKDQILELIEKFGSKGYTISNASGQGSRGLRASDFAGRNIRIETIVSEKVGQKIIDAIAEKYFEDYAVIAYSQKVSVVRGDKYI